QRAKLDATLYMLDELQNAPAAQRDWADLASFAGELGGHSDANGWRRRRLDEALRILGERRLEWNATLEDYELNRDVREAIDRGDTPDTPAGQAIVARWCVQIKRLIGSDSRLRDALVLVMEAHAGRTDSPRRAYLDRAL